MLVVVVAGVVRYVLRPKPTTTHGLRRPTILRPAPLRDRLQGAEGLAGAAGGSRPRVLGIGDRRFGGVG